MSNQTLTIRSIVNDDGAALLDIARGTITTLNPTGAYVWQALERGQSVESVARGLAQRTGQDVSSIEIDVREFVGTLINNKLLSER